MVQASNSKERFSTESAQIQGEDDSQVGNLTTVGHYAFQILPQEIKADKRALLTLPKEEREKEDLQLMLHR